ncbi:MAG: type VI secretion system-associated protein TagF [Variovorax sp.]|nr:type VI secretion system-associated protein TagF [Variovorax sp.]
MLQFLLAHRRVSSPAIWGKLPGHADFVRSGVRHGEGEGWQSWLAEHAAMDTVDVAASLPAAFVLPPRSVTFAPRHFMLGVIAPSEDRAGRRHALLVYQRAHPRWVHRYFQAQAGRQRDWLFWLARTMSKHLTVIGLGELRALERSVHALWQLHRPEWRELGQTGAAAKSQDKRDEFAAMLLDRCTAANTVAPADDAAHGLNGVRYLPWADWPGRLHGIRAQGVFWQQDAVGGFVNAGTRLADLWRTAS